jgi:hypothetical protein
MHHPSRIGRWFRFSWNSTRIQLAKRHREGHLQVTDKLFTADAWNTQPCCRDDPAGRLYNKVG